MLDLMRTTRKRLACLLGASMLLAGGISAAGLAGAGPADAVACGTAILAGTSCTATGTASLTAGTLSMTSPGALAWTGTLTGLDLNLVDTTTAHQSYLVDDATGSGAGWHVTVSATQFTTGTVTLSNTGTFSTNGGTSSITATTPPSATCFTGSTCTLPTNTTTYPVAITTAASSPTPVTVYDTSATTGRGSITIGGTPNPVGWWLNIPSNTAFGTYTSTVTLELISGP
jgi:hypothetical protein